MSLIIGQLWINSLLLCFMERLKISRRLIAIRPIRLLIIDDRDGCEDLASFTPPSFTISSPTIAPQIGIAFRYFKTQFMRAWNRSIKMTWKKNGLYTYYIFFVLMRNVNTHYPFSFPFRLLIWTDQRMKEFTKELKKKSTTFLERDKVDIWNSTRIKLEQKINTLIYSVQHIPRISRGISTCCTFPLARSVSEHQNVTVAFS